MYAAPPAHEPAGDRRSRRLARATQIFAAIYCGYTLLGLAFGLWSDGLPPLPVILDRDDIAPPARWPIIGLCALQLLIGLALPALRRSGKNRLFKAGMAAFWLGVGAAAAWHICRVLNPPIQ